MSRIMVVGNENIAVGGPVFLDVILLNLARKRTCKFFGTGITLGGEWHFTLDTVEALRSFTFSKKNCIKIDALPHCMVIVNIEESEELRWALRAAMHKVEVVLHSY